MKQSIIIFFKCLLTIFIYIIVTVLMGPLAESLFGVNVQSASIPNPSRVMIGLLSTAIIQSLILILLAWRSKLKGIKLGILLSLVLLTINQILNIMEGLVFLSNIYPVRAQMAGLLSGIILSGAMGFSTAFLWGKKNGQEANEEPKVFNWSVKVIAPWISWMIIWFVIYIIAGLLVPMNTIGVNDYYFGPNGVMDESLVPIGALLQIPRSSIWILLAITLYKYIDGTAFEKAIITALTFGGLMSSVLLVPNYIMPDLIRLAHLPEILFANMLWGFVISYRVGKFFVFKK